MKKSVKALTMCVQETTGGFAWKVNLSSDEKVKN